MVRTIWEGANLFFSLGEPGVLRLVAPQRSLCRSLHADGRQSPRAVGAMVISPALQRGVGETNNSSGVPEGRRSCSVPS
jgi:hypothetical protein